MIKIISIYELIIIKHNKCNKLIEKSTGKLKYEDEIISCKHGTILHFGGYVDQISGIYNVNFMRYYKTFPEFLESEYNIICNKTLINIMNIRIINDIIGTNINSKLWIQLSIYT